VEDGGLRFEARLRAATDGGKLTLKEDEITVEGADAAMLILAAATSFRNYKDISADPAQLCQATIDAAAAKTYQALLASHLADYQRLFRRVSLDLGRTASFLMPTDERLKAQKQSDDPPLAALYFQFGRYLLIASSRPGAQPANLRGIWNDSLKPPWDSKWTVNINTDLWRGTAPINAWPNGAFTGLRARGGCELDLQWNDGKPTRATLRASLTAPQRLRPPQGCKITEIRSAGQTLNLNTPDGRTVLINVQAGREYQIQFSRD
jgi:hypothetical protein